MPCRTLSVISWISIFLTPTAVGQSQVDVDILIGVDQYWELTTGKTHRGSEGPVAVETELGWVLSGPAPTAGDISMLTFDLHHSCSQG